VQYVTRIFCYLLSSNDHFSSLLASRRSRSSTSFLYHVTCAERHPQHHRRCILVLEPNRKTVRLSKTADNKYYTRPTVDDSPHRIPSRPFNHLRIYLMDENTKMDCTLDRVQAVNVWGLMERSVRWSAFFLRLCCISILPPSQACPL
jgi:hypothetical protein